MSMFDDSPKDEIAYSIRALREEKRWGKVELAEFLIDLLDACLEGYFGDEATVILPDEKEAK